MPETDDRFTRSIVASRQPIVQPSATADPTLDAVDFTNEVNAHHSVASGNRAWNAAFRKELRSRLGTTRSARTELSMYCLESDELGGECRIRFHQFVVTVPDGAQPDWSVVRHKDEVGPNGQATSGQAAHDLPRTQRYRLAAAFRLGPLALGYSVETLHLFQQVVDI